MAARPDGPSAARNVGEKWLATPRARPPTRPAPAPAQVPALEGERREREGGGGGERERGGGRSSPTTPAQFAALKRGARWTRARWRTAALPRTPSSQRQKRGRGVQGRGEARARASPRRCALSLAHHNASFTQSFCAAESDAESQDMMQVCVGVCVCVRARVWRPRAASLFRENRQCEREHAPPALLYLHLSNKCRRPSPTPPSLRRPARATPPCWPPCRRPIWHGPWRRWTKMNGVCVCGGGGGGGGGGGRGAGAPAVSPLPTSLAAHGIPIIIIIKQDPPPPRRLRPDLGRPGLHPGPGWPRRGRPAEQRG